MSLTRVFQQFSSNILNFFIYGFKHTPSTLQLDVFVGKMFTFFVFIIGGIFALRRITYFSKVTKRDSAVSSTAFSVTFHSRKVTQSDRSCSGLSEVPNEPRRLFFYFYIMYSNRLKNVVCRRTSCDDGGKYIFSMQDAKCKV